MPVDYSLYHPKWTLISKLVRKRAGHRCERCGVAEFAIVYWNGRAYVDKGARHDAYWEYRWQGHGNYDHNRDNNKFWNLLALCDRCHLAHDRRDNARQKKYGRHHRINQLSIYQPLAYL